MVSCLAAAVALLGVLVLLLLGLVVVVEPLPLPLDCDWLKRLMKPTRRGHCSEMEICLVLSEQFG